MLLFIGSVVRDCLVCAIFCVYVYRANSFLSLYCSSIYTSLPSSLFPYSYNNHRSSGLYELMDPARYLYICLFVQHTTRFPSDDLNCCLALIHKEIPFFFFIRRFSLFHDDVIPYVAPLRSEKRREVLKNVCLDHTKETNGPAHNQTI